jgi:nucleoside 2-deoxyribosyltransferase
MKSLVDKLRESELIKHNCKFILPVLLEDTVSQSYVFSDIRALEKSDVLLIHIPEPSVGACAELGYFKACKPTKPIIGYKCMIHPWIRHLCDFRIDHVDHLIEILETMILGKKEV